MTTAQALMTLGTVAAVTLALRAWPFLLFPENKETPNFLQYLGRVLPYAIMGMLVVYCLRDTGFAGLGDWLPGLASVAFVVVAHRLWHSLPISLIGGTALYMVLIRLI